MTTATNSVSTIRTAEGATRKLGRVQTLLERHERIERKKARQVAKLKLQIAAIEAALGERQEPLRRDIFLLASALLQFRETHPELVPKNRVGIRLDTGDIAIHQMPKRELVIESEGALIAELRKRRLLTRFTQLVRVVRRDELQANKDMVATLRSVRFASGQKGIIIPAGFDKVTIELLLDYLEKGWSIKRKKEKEQK